MPKILILSDSSSEYSRRLLKGIVRYSKERGGWSFYRMPLYYREQHGEEGVVKWARKWNADAIIIAQDNNLNLSKFEGLDIPIVFPNMESENCSWCNLTGNYVECGVMAAHYYMGKGYENFAFYGTLDHNWSYQRLQGFVLTLEEAEYTANVYSGAISIRNDQWSYQPEELIVWLRSLPKPVAIFSSADYFAIHITETCRIYNIKVPAEVAVLGVDDDPLICEISDPPLSSIQLDIENSGYRTAELLDKRIASEQPYTFHVTVNHTGVVERKSTEQYATNDKGLLAVISHIHTNYAKAIHVDELASISCYSRRVLEKRFKNQFKSSIYQFILQFRINKLSHALIHTDLPLYQLAEQCGFEEPKNIARIFTKIKKITPSEYRKRYQTTETTLQ